MSANAQTAVPLQLQPSPTPDLAPIAPPVYVFPYPPWMVATAVAVLLLIGGAITWAVIRYIKNRPKPPPPTPREIALAALEKLRIRIASTEAYSFSIDVSDVLRAFVTAEYRMRATRQTSPEFLAAVSASPRFSQSDKTLLSDFLEKADLIKFARLAATACDSEQLLEQARRFVEGGGAA